MLSGGKGALSCGVRALSLSVSSWLSTSGMLLRCFMWGAAHNRTVAATGVCVVLLSPQAQAAHCQ